ncbi:MAG: tRNA 2-selenouridine(34) synthase MnmH [Rikenellaceae bacterium]
MPKIISVDEFLERGKSLPIIDVRSPGEYEHAHIPGALTLPLFTNDQRAEVGTIYKQRGRVQAVQKGLEFAGPKLKEFTKFALKFNSNELLIYCWRGGMRSSAMAWLLETVGLNCCLLQDGYKAYRNYVLHSFETPYNILLLGGYTGSGKTEILQALREAGEQVIDLEGLSNHKGSAFGALGQGVQPSSEQFENRLCAELEKLSRDRIVWVEDESRNVGKVTIPHGIWNQMRAAKLIRVDTPYDIRLSRLMRDYAYFDIEGLAGSIKRIEKRLGYDKCKIALEACLSGDRETAARICLNYYDVAYGNQLMARFEENQSLIPHIEVNSLDSAYAVKELLSISSTLEKR